MTRVCARAHRHSSEEEILRKKQIIARLFPFFCSLSVAFLCCTVQRILIFSGTLMTILQPPLLLLLLHTHPVKASVGQKSSDDGLIQEAVVVVVARAQPLFFAARLHSFRRRPSRRRRRGRDEIDENSNWRLGITRVLAWALLRHSNSNSNNNCSSGLCQRSANLAPSFDKTRPSLHSDRARIIFAQSHCSKSSLLIQAGSIGTCR